MDSRPRYQSCRRRWLGRSVSGGGRRTVSTLCEFYHHDCAECLANYEFMARRAVARAPRLPSRPTVIRMAHCIEAIPLVVVSKVAPCWSCAACMGQNGLGQNGCGMRSVAAVGWCWWFVRAWREWCRWCEWHGWCGWMVLRMVLCVVGALWLWLLVVIASLYSPPKP